MGPPHSPQLNGVAERYNRTILDRSLPSLLYASLPIKFWEDAAHHTLSSLNLSPTRANENHICPQSLWTEKPASYKSLRAFGCKVFWLVTGPARQRKLIWKTSDSVHLYTLPGGDGFMVWDLLLNRAVKTHDAVHHEHVFPGVGVVSRKTISNWMIWSNKTSTALGDITSFRPMSLYERRLSASIHNPPSLSSSISSPTQMSKSDNTEDPQNQESLSSTPTPSSLAEEQSPSPEPASPSPEPPTPLPRRGTRTQQAPMRYGFASMAKTVSNSLSSHNVPLPTAMIASNDPQSFREAPASTDCDKWVKAMAIKMESLIDKKVFELCPLPKGKHAIGC